MSRAARILGPTGVAFCLAVISSPLARVARAQQIVDQYEPVPGLLRIGPEADRVVPMTERGHTLILPEDSARGVIVFIDPWRFPVEDFEPRPDELETEALSRSVAILHISTGNPLDFLFEEEEVEELALRIRAVLEANALSGAPVFLGGLSLGGTRALRLAEFLAVEGASVGFRPAAVAIVDAPLDMVRLWTAERRAAADGFHPAAADEGRWVTYLLETNLGGTPLEARDRYVRYSPFVYGEEAGGNAVHLREVPIRAYHEPDVDWWIENRRKSYYSMNSLDLAALINELRLLGNDRAFLITTHQRRAGFEQGSSPHTWSIVDDGELVDWFLEQVRK